MNKEKTPSFQILSSKDFKITIDYLSDEAFDVELDAKEVKNGEVVESRRKKIVSIYRISNLTETVVNLNEFARAILNACISEQAAGNEYTTPERIFRWLGGSYNLSDDMRKAIMDSLEHLAGVRIEINMEIAQEKIGYGKDRGKSTFKGYLLPTETLEAKINGQTVKSAIRILRKGIIFSVADMKNQVITCDQKLLEAPIRHSERGIALNHFIVRRTLEIKGSHEAHKANPRVSPLRRVISFETMLKKCGMENVDRDTRRKVKNITEKILNYLVDNGVIKSFAFEIGDTGKIRSITFEF